MRNHPGSHSTRSRTINTAASVDRVETPVASQSLETALTIAKVADEFRGQEIVVLDLRAITPITDYFVIVTANSGRQMLALADEVNRVLKAMGQPRLGVEGMDSSSWVLEDFGDVVLHVFLPEPRKMYDLERLWADGIRVDWRETPAR